MQDQTFSFICICITEFPSSNDYEDHNVGGVEGVANGMLDVPSTSQNRNSPDILQSQDDTFGSKVLYVSKREALLDDSSGPEEELSEIPENSTEAKLYEMKYNFITDRVDGLSVKKGDKIKIIRRSDKGDMCEVTNSQDQIGWVPTSSINIPPYGFPWYHGNITRAGAELSLSSGINGTFLIRGSISNPGQYYISLKCNGQVYHYIICEDPHTSKYFVRLNSKFDSLSELVEHHSKDSNGLRTCLNHPAPYLHKTGPHSPLQEVNKWEVNRMDIQLKTKIGVGQLKDVYEAVFKKNFTYVTIKPFTVSCINNHTVRKDKIKISTYWNYRTNLNRA